MACVKFRPIIHVIEKSPNYTTLAWVKFELKIFIRINLQANERIDRGKLVLVIYNIVILQSTTTVTHLAVTPIALLKIGTVLAPIFHNVVTQQQVQTSFSK